MAHRPHVLIVTETWLHQDVNDYEIRPLGYRINRNDRDSYGGGVAILFQESLCVMRLPDIRGIECVIIKVILDELNIVIGGFYHKFWRYLSSKQSPASSVLVNNEAVTDKGEIEALNDYFCSVCTSDNYITPDLVTYEEIIAIEDVSISGEGVLSLLLNLDPNKSPGIDAIPNDFLIRYTEWCAKYLCLIFKASLSRSELPNDWKHAKITPVP